MHPSKKCFFYQSLKIWGYDNFSHRNARITKPSSYGHIYNLIRVFINFVGDVMNINYDVITFILKWPRVVNFEDIIKIIIMLMSAKPKWCVTWFMYFWIFFSEDITAKFHHWRSCVTWRPFCDQSADPSWIRLRFLLWIILCIKEYERISANTSCDSVACVSCIITHGACLDWVDLDGAAATACFTSIFAG